MKWMLVLESEGNQPSVIFYNTDVDLAEDMSNIVSRIDRYTSGAHFFELDGWNASAKASLWMVDSEFNVYSKGRNIDFRVDDSNVDDLEEIVDFLKFELSL